MDMEGMSVVTEQGMFGDLGLKDPNVRDVELSEEEKNKRKNEKRESK